MDSDGAIRVLYVDDEPGLLEIGKLFLEKDGRFAVDTITSAPAALDRLHVAEYDAIIADYLMPEMDGIEFLKKVRSSGNPIPFILFTGRGREEVVIQALNEGADFYLQKGGQPTPQFTELSHKVHQAVQKRKAETERQLTEEEVRQKNQLLVTIHELEREFAELPSGWRVEDLAAKKLSALSGAVVTVFSSYFPADQLLRTTSIEFAPGILESLPGSWEKVSRWMGMQPDKVEIPINKEMYHDINRSIIGTKKTIAEISYGRISPLVSASIQKLSGIDRFIHIAHIIDGELYGTSVIGLRPDQRDPSWELLDSFGHMVAVSLRRQRAEAALRESEDRYRTLIENADEAILVIQDGRICFANPKLMKIAGYSTGEFEQKPFLEFVHPDDRAMVEKQHKLRLSGEILREQYTCRILTKGGSVLWNEIRASLITWNGQTAVLVLLQDITERKTAEEALEKSEEKFRETVSNVPGIVFRFRVSADGKSRLSFFSDRSLDILGIDPRQDDLFTLLTTHVHPDDRNEFLASVTAAIQSRGRWKTEARFVKPSGETVWLEGMSEPVLHGDELIYTGFINEITERKRVEFALRESEEKFRSLVEYALDPILIADFEGSVLLANKAAARLVEAGEGTILTGRNVMEFIAPESREGVIRDFLQVAQGHDAYLAKYSVMSAQGRRIRVECIGKLITYEGKPADIISLRDITESEKAVEVLRESEEKYRTLASHLPEYIFIHRSGIIQYVNQAITEITGRSASEMCGHSFMEFVAPESRAVVEENIRLRDLGSKQSTYEIAILVKDGGKRYGIVNSALIPYEGAPASLVVVSDITHRKFAEDALRRSNRQLSLLSGITRHDISNQLLTLNGFITLLHGKVPDPALEKFFTRIKEASDQISAMIRFTKEFEQIGAGSPVWQDLPALVNTAGKDVLFGEVVLKNDIPSGTEVFADPLIVRVFFNLMDNALRHGGGLTTIRFSLAFRNGDRIILCEDDGTGVPGEEKEKIFDRGFGRNTGFGLAISREILDITGITIRENGEPGQGARFEILVPKEAYRVNGP